MLFMFFNKEDIVINIIFSVDILKFDMLVKVMLIIEINKF